MNQIKLSLHFTLEEFLNTKKYPCNKPTTQHLVNMTYGCLMLLEPARTTVGPIIINSGYRNADVNALVGGVKRYPSQGPPTVSAPRRLPAPSRPHRPAPHRLRLAPHLVGTLRPAPPLCQNRVLQVTKFLFFSFLCMRMRKFSYICN